ncbi:MAG: hypothetical protein ACPGEC_04515 [Flavobacteriales bacterium]
MKFKGILFTLFISFLFSIQAFAQDSNPRLKGLVEHYKALKLKSNTIEVYRIQVFSGSRGGGNSILGSVRAEFPELISELTYDQPNFKVKLGAFRTRAQAQKFIQNLGRKYSQFILKESMDYDNFIRPIVVPETEEDVYDDME